MSPLVLPLAVGLLLAGLSCGMLFGVGCSENLHPYTDRTRTCEAISAWGGLWWWAAVLAPPVALLVTQLTAWGRGHVLATTLLIAIVLSAGWTYLLLVVSSNIGDTSSG